MDSKPSHHTPLAYFITFTTYGTWLHGDERGSTDRMHNVPDTPRLSQDVEWRRYEQTRLRETPLYLNEGMRNYVLSAILDVCRHHRWQAHAVHVRSNHIHAIVTGNATPEKMMNAFKAYATRALRNMGGMQQRQHVWTRHGSTRYLWTPTELDQTLRYVGEGQGDIASLGSYAP